MIVEATLEANWRSSLTITPKEVDTFSSNCENSGLRRRFGTPSHSSCGQALSPPLSTSCPKLETLCAVTYLPLPHLAKRGRLPWDALVETPP